MNTIEEPRVYISEHEHNQEFSLIWNGSPLCKPSSLQTCLACADKYGLQVKYIWNGFEARFEEL